MDTSAQTVAPLADRGINDRLVELRPLVDETRFEFIDVSNFGTINFLLQNSRRCSRPGWGLANSAATVSEVSSQVSAAPVSVHVEFGTFAFNTVRWWRKLGEVENECTSHIFGSFAIFLPKTIKINGNLRQFWQKQICLVFFWDTVYIQPVEDIVTKWNEN